jgi:orotidine-5'-phosphate decarboxylase
MNEGRSNRVALVLGTERGKNWGALNNPIIVALDVADQKSALELIERIGGAVGFYKIGLQLFTKCGPGVRPEWAEANDQQRMMTPRAAMQAGADYLVIGRPITAHENPREAAERILAEIAA